MDEQEARNIVNSSLKFNPEKKSILDAASVNSVAEFNDLRLTEQEVKAVLTLLKARSNQNLISLKFNNCYIGSGNIALLKDVITRNSANLKYLELCNAKLSASEILQIINDLPMHLEALNLARNELNDCVANAIAAKFTNTSAVQWLLLENLGGEGIKEQGGKALATMLENKAIRVLHLGGNNLGNEAIQDILKALQNNHSHLEWLALWGRPYGNKQVIDELIKLLDKHKARIKTLDIGGMNLGQRAIDIAKQLRVCTQLKELSFWGTGLNDTSIEAFAERNSGQALTSLEVLNIGDNNLTDASINALAEWVSANKALKTAALKNNQFSDLGLAVIIEYLPISIYELDLGEQRPLGEWTCAALAKRLSGGHFPKLKHLHIHSNNLPYEFKTAIKNHNLLDKTRLRNCLSDITPPAATEYRLAGDATERSIIKLTLTANAILVNIFDGETEKWTTKQPFNLDKTVLTQEFDMGEDINQPCYIDTFGSLLATVGENTYLICYMRAQHGILLLKYDLKHNQWNKLPPITDEFSNSRSWDRPQYYLTLQAQVIGEQLFILGRGASQLYGRYYNLNDYSIRTMKSFEALTDANGWNDPLYHRALRLHTLVVNNKPRLLLLAHNKQNLQLFSYNPEKDPHLYPNLDQNSQPWETKADAALAGYTKPLYWDSLRSAVIVKNNSEVLAVVFMNKNGIAFHTYEPATNTWARYFNPEIYGYSEAKNQMLLAYTMQLATINYTDRSTVFIAGRFFDEVIDVGINTKYNSPWSPVGQLTTNLNWQDSVWNKNTLAACKTFRLLPIKINNTQYMSLMTNEHIRIGNAYGTSHWFEIKEKPDVAVFITACRQSNSDRIDELMADKDILPKLYNRTRHDAKTAIEEAFTILDAEKEQNAKLIKGIIKKLDSHLYEAISHDTLYSGNSSNEYNHHNILDKLVKVCDLDLKPYLVNLLAKIIETKTQRFIAWLNFVNDPVNDVRKAECINMLSFYIRHLDKLVERNDIKYLLNNYINKLAEIKRIYHDIELSKIFPHFNYDIEAQLFSQLTPNQGPQWSNSHHWESDAQVIRTATIDNKVFVIGKEKTGQITLHEFNSDTREWTAKCSGPHWNWNEEKNFYTISLSALSSSTGKQLVLLGRNEHGLQLLRYEPVKDQWNTLPLTEVFPNCADIDGWHKPEQYKTLSKAVLNNHLYIWGIASHGCILWRYDIESDQWENLRIASSESWQDIDKALLENRAERLYSLNTLRQNNKDYLCLIVTSAKQVDAFIFDLDSMRWSIKNIKHPMFEQPDTKWRYLAPLNSCDQNGFLFIKKHKSSINLLHYDVNRNHWSASPPLPNNLWYGQLGNIDLTKLNLITLKDWWVLVDASLDVEPIKYYACEKELTSWLDFGYGKAQGVGPTILKTKNLALQIEVAETNQQQQILLFARHLTGYKCYQGMETKSYYDRLTATKLQPEAEMNNSGKQANVDAFMQRKSTKRFFSSVTKQSSEQDSDQGIKLTIINKSHV